jgi:hypothetical protein
VINYYDFLKIIGLFKITDQLKEDIILTKLSDEFIEELDHICEVINKIAIANKCK